MTNTAVKTFTAIETTEMVRNQIEEHIQEQVEKIQEKRTIVRGRLRRFISFLLSCEEDTPSQLSPSMKARLYL